jgi:hypothetical protein
MLAQRALERHTQITRAGDRMKAGGMRDEYPRAAGSPHAGWFIARNT